MQETEELKLLKHFYLCSHRLHMAQKYPGQGRILILLLENGTMMQRELIRITGRRSATLSEQLENMENAGFLHRRKNETDKRNVDVTLTKKGKAAAEGAGNFRDVLAEQLFGSFSETEKNTFSGLLDRMTENLAAFADESGNEGEER